MKRLAKLVVVSMIALLGMGQPTPPEAPVTSTRCPRYKSVSNIRSPPAFRTL